MKHRTWILRQIVHIVTLIREFLNGGFIRPNLFSEC